MKEFRIPSLSNQGYLYFEKRYLKIELCSISHENDKSQTYFQEI